MDDNSFDDIIKRKVRDHEDPEFDPSALAAFNHRMSTLNYLPWYSRYRTALMVGSGVAMSTLFIIFSLWLMNANGSKALAENKLFIQSQQEQIAKLQHEINDLKKHVTDTVYITQVEVLTSPPNNAVLNRITALELTILKMREELAIEYESVKNSSRERDALSITSTTVQQGNSELFHSKIIPDEKSKKSLKAIPKPISNSPLSNTPFSVKTFRELEKHYKKGIGVRVGPILEFSKGFYSEGAGGIDITGGLLGDFLVSPSLSIETGGKFIHRFYKISEDELKSNSELPYINPDLAPLGQADIDSWMVEIPLNLKYRYPLSPKTHALAGLGFSSIIYTKQVLEYSYNFDSVPAGHVTEPHTISNFARYGGTLNVSLGFSKRLKNKKILETSLYYQHGLGDSGIEKMRSNYLGIRGAYWFTLK